MFGWSDIDEFVGAFEPVDAEFHGCGDEGGGEDGHEDEDGEEFLVDDSHGEADGDDDDFDGAAAVHAESDDEAFFTGEFRWECEEPAADDFTDECEDEEEQEEAGGFSEDAEGELEADDDEENWGEKSHGEVVDDGVHVGVDFFVELGLAEEHAGDEPTDDDVEVGEGREIREQEGDDEGDGEGGGFVDEAVAVHEGFEPFPDVGEESVAEEEGDGEECDCFEDDEADAGKSDVAGFDEASDAGEDNEDCDV